MTHYAIESWVDYVRGLGLPEVRDRMAAHLAGCPRCGQTVAIVNEIAAVVRIDAEEVPEAIVRAALTLFEPPLPKPPPPVIARLVPDPVSHLGFGPVPTVDQRRLLFEAAEMQIDLRLGRGSEIGRTRMSGRLAGGKSSAAIDAEVTVHEALEDGPIAQARTNERGEFLLEYLARSPVFLHITFSNQGSLTRVVVDTTQPCLD